MPDEPEEPEAGRVVGADRVIAVLIELAGYPQGVTLEELAVRLGSTKSSVHRALTSLRRVGLASQLSRGVYVLGDEFVRLANRFQAARPEGALIEPALRILAREFGETAHLAVLDGTEVVYRAKVDPPAGGVRLTSMVGGRNPAHRTAVGKLLLSYAASEEPELRRLYGDEALRARTDRSITTFDDLWHELELTRSRGYAVDDQENEEGINCVAVPVRWAPDALPAAAVSISGLAFRTPLERLVDAVPFIEETIAVALRGEPAR